MDYNDMVKTLRDSGITHEAAHVAAQQYENLWQIDKGWALNYAAEVQSKVTGLYEILLHYYKDKLDDDDDIDFLYDYVGSIVSRNLDYIINSYREQFADDIAEGEIDYEDYEPISATDPYKDYTDQLRKRAGERKTVAPETQKLAQQRKDTLERKTKSQKKIRREKPIVEKTVKTRNKSVLKKPIRKTTKKQKAPGMVGKVKSAIKGIASAFRKLFR